MPDLDTMFEKLTEATEVLGPDLDGGSPVDLLLDNFPIEIREARAVVEAWKEEQGE